MEPQESSTQCWRFGIFKVDGRRSELRRNGTPVKLREQSFRILVLLLERARRGRRIGASKKRKARH